MQNNWFCSKNPRRNSFIKYLHLAVKNILCQPKLFLLSFSSYFITRFCFIVHYHAVPIGRSEILGLPFLHCEQCHSYGHFIVADCPAFSSSKHRGCHHNRRYLNCLCRAVAYEGCNRRDQGMILIIYYLSTLPLTLGLTS